MDVIWTSLGLSRRYHLTSSWASSESTRISSFTYAVATLGCEKKDVIWGSGRLATIHTRGEVGYFMQKGEMSSRSSCCIKGQLHSSRPPRIIKRREAGSSKRRWTNGSIMNLANCTGSSRMDGIVVAHNDLRSRIMLPILSLSTMKP